MNRRKFSFLFICCCCLSSFLDAALPTLTRENDGGQNFSKYMCEHCQSNSFIFLSLLFITTYNNNKMNSRVIALDPTIGVQLWQSTDLPGRGAGTPVSSHDGRYVWANTNSAGWTVGHFSMLDTSEVVSGGGAFTNTTEGGDLEPAFSYRNQGNPFSPLGIYLQPTEGYYTYVFFCYCVNLHMYHIIHISSTHRSFFLLLTLPFSHAQWRRV